MSFVDEDYIPESGALFNFGEIGCEELISKIWIKNDPIKQMSCGDQFVVLITESGRAFSYGKNDWGQLGLGHTTMETNPCCIKSLRGFNEKAAYVACGRCHTLISTESNKLFGCGSNSDGQLGIDVSISSVMEPKEVTSWNGGPIKQLAAGGEFSAALAEAGDLYVWGSNNESQLGLNITDEGISQPTKLKFFPSPVATMCCGSYHMGAITMDTLYIWGEVSDGKLGLGDGIQTNQSFPQKVRLNSSAKQIACGNNHTICLTSTGDVYVWGYGESGQIGLGPSQLFVNQPTSLKLPSKLVNAFGDNGSLMEKFVKISAGERHTAVINANGLIFTFGDGRHGKLGNFGGSNSYSNRMWPTIIEKLSNDMWAEDVVCGGCHTVVLIRLRHTDEQLDGLNNNYLFSTLQANSDTNRGDNTAINVRRQRRNNKNKENADDDSNLPTLKSSISAISNGTVDAHRKRKDSSTNVEEQITDVRNKALQSTPNETIDSEMMSTDTDELEKIKEEMAKCVNKANVAKPSSTRRESFDEKVDKFSGLMDSVYGEEVPDNMESSEEIIRKRPRKKRKIKAVQANIDGPQGFGQPVLNNNVSSDKEDDDPVSNNIIKEKDKEEIPKDVHNTEVSKVGCQANCRGKQDSGTCSVI